MSDVTEGVGAAIGLLARATVQQNSLISNWLAAVPTPLGKIHVRVILAIGEEYAAELDRTLAAATEAGKFPPVTRAFGNPYRSDA